PASAGDDSRRSAAISRRGRLETNRFCGIERTANPRAQRLPPLYKTRTRCKREGRLFGRNLYSDRVCIWYTFPGVSACRTSEQGTGAKRPVRTSHETARRRRGSKTAGGV